jgi:hypothetical protein
MAPLFYITIYIDITDMLTTFRLFHTAGIRIFRLLRVNLNCTLFSRPLCQGILTNAHNDF